MLFYFLMFLVPAAVALTSDRGEFRPDGTVATRRFTLGWALAWLVLTLIIGYRYEVGGDWFTYVDYMSYVFGASLERVLALPDPGYMLLNWIAAEMGWSVVGVNVLGAVIFAVGLVRFCRSLPRPWLALAVAVAYLVIVVGMGYSRQGIALSLTLLGLLALQRGSLLQFFVWVALAATFHKTAALLLPIAALASSTNRWWTFGWAVVVTIAAYFLFLAESVDTLYLTYVEAEYESAGALIRLLMNAVPALLLLIFSKRFAFTRAGASLWRWYAVISLVLLGLLFLTTASTALDRIALYMIPLQMVVFSYLPSAFVPRSRRKQLPYVILILGYYLLVLGVWLIFATHSQYWLPYRFYPLEVLSW